MPCHFLFSMHIFAFITFVLSFAAPLLLSKIYLFADEVGQEDGTKELARALANGVVRSLDLIRLCLYIAPVIIASTHLFIRVCSCLVLSCLERLCCRRPQQ